VKEKQLSKNISVLTMSFIIDCMLCLVIHMKSEARKICLRLHTEMNYFYDWAWFLLKTQPKVKICKVNTKTRLSIYFF